MSDDHDRRRLEPYERAAERLVREFRAMGDRWAAAKVDERNVATATEVADKLERCIAASRRGNVNAPFEIEECLEIVRHLAAALDAEVLRRRARGKRKRD
jgi:hypothetical protein